jgi:hypothetical protein
MAKTKRGIQNISDTEQKRQEKSTKSFNKKGQRKIQGMVSSMRNVPIGSFDFNDLDDAACDSMIVMGRR